MMLSEKEILKIKELEKKLLGSDVGFLEKTFKTCKRSITKNIRKYRRKIRQRLRRIAP